MREVIAALQDRTRGVHDRMDGRDIAKVMHSMAKLHQRGLREDPGLLAAMQRRAAATAGEFSPQDVANVLWALDTMGVTADRVLLEACMIRHLPAPMTSL